MNLLKEFISKVTYKHLLIGAIISLGLLLRINGLGEHSLWIDEAGTASLVKTFLEDGVPKYPSGDASYRSMPFILITSLSVSLFGMNDFALRLPSVFFGVFTIFLVFKWGSEISNFKTGLLASAMISFSSWHIALSQNARMYSLFQLTYFGVFYFLYKYEIEKKSLYITLALVTSIFSLFTHITGYILIFTVPSYLIISKLDFRSRIITSLITVFLTIIITEFTYLNDISNIVDKLSFSPEGALEHLIWMQENLTFMFFTSILGFLTLFYRKNSLFYLYSIAIIPPTVVYFFFVEMAASRYLFFTIPFLTVLSSLFIFRIAEIKFLSNLEIKTMLPVLAIVLVAVSGNPMDPELGSYSPQPDYKSIYKYVDEHSTDRDLLISSRPLPADHYYKNPDYVIVQEFVEEELLVDGQELYSGSPIIQNKSKLKQVLEDNPNVWIVSTSRVYPGLKQGLRNQIQNQTLVKSERNITLWRATQESRTQS